MLSFECIKNEKSVYFLLTSAISNKICNICRSNVANGQMYRETDKKPKCVSLNGCFGERYAYMSNGC